MKNLELTEEVRKQMIIDILSDSIIWYNVSNAMVAANAAFHHSNMDFEPENKFDGYAIAYRLMGLDSTDESDNERDLLHSLFHASLDWNEKIPIENKRNAAELAERVFDQWTLALSGKEELSTV